MNLGIDLDGVVYNSEEWFKAFGEVYDMAKGGNGPIKPQAIFKIDLDLQMMRQER